MDWIRFRDWTLGGLASELDSGGNGDGGGRICGWTWMESNRKYSTK